MSIFLNKDTKVIVQGITGGEGTKHTALMLKAGTKVVGGVNARKAGTTVSHIDKDGNAVELPVFGTVAEAIKETGADVSIAFVPPAFTKDAIIEAIDAEIPLLVVITEGIPVQDTAESWAYTVDKGNKTRIIGPNCPGIITPGESLVGITPANITGKGPIGLVSKSGTLTYQMMYELRDLGFSTAIGIGGDPVIGTTHIDALEAFENDPETKAIVMIGEIGGDAEERAADYIKANVTKPVVGYVAGFTAPEGKTMGHAGAIVSGSAGTAQAKKEALEAAGVKVGKTPSETAELMREIMQGLCAGRPGLPLPPFEQSANPRSRVVRNKSGEVGHALGVARTGSRSLSRTLVEMSVSDRLRSVLPGSDDASADAVEPSAGSHWWRGAIVGVLTGLFSLAAGGGSRGARLAGRAAVGAATGGRPPERGPRCGCWCPGRT